MIDIENAGNASVVSTPSKEYSQILSSIPQYILESYIARESTRFSSEMQGNGIDTCLVVSGSLDELQDKLNLQKAASDNNQGEGVMTASVRNDSSPSDSSAMPEANEEVSSPSPEEEGDSEESEEEKEMIIGGSDSEDDDIKGVFITGDDGEQIEVFE